MRRNTGMIEAVMRQHRLMFFFVGVLVVFGGYALLKMPKQEFPIFTIRQGVVIGVYPGATSAQVEEQLTKPLENFLFTYKEINRKKTYSMSRDGVVYVMVELEDNVNNKDEVWSKIKHGLALFKMQLPSGVLAVIANDDFGDTSALLIALESDTRSYRELEDYAEILENKLRRLKSASNFRRYGSQKEQISVYLDRDKLAVYGINYRILATNLLTEGLTTVSALLETGDVNMPIHFSSVYDSEEEVAEQIIYSNPDGTIVKLKDVATIIKEYDSPDRLTENNGRKAIILSMEMREGNNIVAYGKDVDEILEDFYEIIPEDVVVQRIADQPKVVGTSVRNFLRDLVIAIVIIILVMVILFPLRSAIIASTNIPITVFITLGLMYFLKIPLNTVTLAALIVILGMIVDNSVVVIDGYLEYLENGMSRWHAAVLSAKNYSGAIFLATISLCTIFLPVLAILTGIWYDFVRHFPWTFGIALMVSFILAMFYIPILEYALIKRKSKKEKKKFDLNKVIQKIYVAGLDWAFRLPVLTIATTVIVVIVSVIAFFNFDQRMFPHADRDQFAVEIYLPQGTPVEKTQVVTDSLYTLLKKDNRITSITSFIGMSSPRFQATYAPNIGGENYAQFIVNTISEESTVELLDKYTSSYQNYFPDAFVRFKQLDYHLSQNPIEIRLSGDDIGSLKQYADTIIGELAGINTLVWLHTNYEEAAPTMQVDLNTAEASRLGIVKSMAELELTGYYTGIPIGTVWENDYSLSVVLKSDKDKANDIPTEVEDKYISTLIPGISVPLRQIADVKPVWHEGQIVRRNGVRTISIMADVKRGYNEDRSFKKVRKIMDNKIAPILPRDIDYEYGGMYEGDMEVIPSITSVVIVAVFIIFLFLLLKFKKIGVALAALLSLSFIVPGTSLGMWITGTELSMTGILGIISLFGITIRNTILIFEHAENLRVNEKKGAREAAYDAGKRRMVPIFLTSATTAIGIIPMILSNSSLWSPMGIIIFWGTIFSMIILVLTLPVMYWKIFDRVKIADVGIKGKLKLFKRNK
ncbi:efflux RND transporter permease subunit [Puteibacter caeruleilacunae]|nr:efflux RND transporter permease subunit [Puteibacter caeruleilacunae]